MRRREFLATTAAATLSGNLLSSHLARAADAKGRTYATPADAMRSPREKDLFVTALRVGIDTNGHDYLATVDVDPASPTYSTVVDRVTMPNAGDELHHFGWNACSSCHADPDKSRRFLVVPGIRSGRIHILDAANPRAMKLHKVIEPHEIVSRTNLSAPHTVHCLADGQIMISMLGDGQGNAPGGFLLLDEKFDVAGRWDALQPGATRNAVRLPAYARLDLRAGRTFLWGARRMTLFAEVLNALDRANIGRTTGSIRATGVVSGFTEALFPRIPSAGVRVEF